MKIIKIIVGGLAAFWFLGILLKLLRSLPFIFNSEFGMSRLLGAVAGLIISGLICYLCFKGVFGRGANTPNPPQI